MVSLFHSNTPFLITGTSYTCLVLSMDFVPQSLNQSTLRLSRSHGGILIGAISLVKCLSSISGWTNLQPHIPNLKQKGCSKAWSSQVPISVWDYLVSHSISYRPRITHELLEYRHAW